MTDVPHPAGLPPELNPRGRSASPRPVTPGSRPVSPRGPSPRRWRRWLGGIATAMSLAILAGVGVVYIAFRHVDGTIHRISTNVGVVGHRAPPAGTARAQNFLLVGSDSRAGLTHAQLKALNLGYDQTGARSDTVILAHVPADNSQATLVSFPRDSWVQIPAWTDGKGVAHPAHFNKLNSAFGEGELPLGNPSLLKATIEELSGLPVDHYLQIDVGHFQKMVDALGGVDVCVAHPAHDHYSGINLAKGNHHIDGRVALQFVRQRHGLPRGDIDRIARQQYFIGSVVRKVTSAGTLLNPFKLSSFVNTAADAVTVDTSFSITGIRNLALRLRHLDAAHVRFVTVPITSLSAYRDRQSVVLLDDARMKALFAGLASGSGAGGTAAKRPAASTLTVAPADVHVRVLNAGGESGLAGRAAGDLRGAGFAVDGVGDRVTHAAGTVVRYGPGGADAARTLAAAIPGATLTPAGDLGSTAELLVGSGYSGVRTVAAGQRAGSPTPAASSGAAGVPARTTTAASTASHCAP